MKNRPIPDPSQAIWLEAGYQLVARKGLSALQVEPLARKAGISKSSFYHHFVDLDLFTSCLLAYHLDRMQVLAEKEGRAQSVDPDLIRILCQHKEDLLFNRQVRVYRDRPGFQDLLSRIDQETADGFLSVWVRDLDNQFSKDELRPVFHLALENFFLQLVAENIEETWLRAYFHELRHLVLGFPIPRVDGSV